MDETGYNPKAQQSPICLLKVNVLIYLHLMTYFYVPLKYPYLSLSSPSHINLHMLVCIYT